MPEHRDVVFEEAEHVPAVTSPYAGKRLTMWDHIHLSAYWFATNFLWGALLVIMLPGEIKKMVPSDRVAAVGLLTGLAAIVALVVPLVVGELSDRCAAKLGRRRPFMIVGISVNLIGLLLMCLVYTSAKPVPPSGTDQYWGTIGYLLSNSTFLEFLFAYIIVQLGNNIASAAYSGVIPDLVPLDQRGVASGYMALMSQLGTLFGVVISGLVLGSLPEMIKYAVLGAGLVGLALVTLLGIKENPLPSAPPKINWGLYIRSLWIDPKLHPDFAWVWLTRALVMLGFYSVLPFVNYYFVDVIHIEKPDKPASMMTGILLIASCVSGVYGGAISDKIGRKSVVYRANFMIAVVALAFIFCRSIPQVLLAGSIFGLGYGAYISVDWALGTDVLPNAKSAGKEMGIWHIAMTLPQTIAAPVASSLIVLFGSTPYTDSDGNPAVHYTILGYASVFILCSACFALGAYLLKNVRGVK